MSYRWWSSCQSNRGQRRKINEDAYLAQPDQGLWIVADGMGGHARGDKASRYVVAAFNDFPASLSLDQKVELARSHLDAANQHIFNESATLGDKQIMGSTVAVFLVQGQNYACLWAGDSRIYMLRNGKLNQLTKDHSVVQQLIDSGEIEPGEARGHPSSNRITRAVGARAKLVVDEMRGTIRDGDSILLCSDGLTIEVEEDEIATVVEELDCESAAQELIDLSLERGARDNVTVGVISFEETTGINSQSADITAVNYALRKHARNRTLPQLTAS